MHTPATNAPALPYDRWARHRADNGLEYLAHPVSGEVKWLWSRHRDPNTGKDYLVNTITSAREWVTPANQHLCPVRPSSIPTTNASTANTAVPNPVAATASALSSLSMISDPSAPSRPQSSQKPSPAALAAAAAAHRRANSNYIEIPAPKSLGLSADEVLMAVRGTGRRYIFNKRTFSSRWLPDTFKDDPAAASILANAANSSLKSIPPTNSTPSTAMHPNVNARNSSTAMPTPPPRLAGDRPTPGNARDAYSAKSESAFNKPANNPVNGTNANTDKPQDAISEKMKLLNGIITKIDAMTSTGKYEMKALHDTVERMKKPNGTNDAKHAEDEHTTSANQRLLELSEYLTQQMLKVDNVESLGDARVRKRRKETVEKILSLIKRVDELRRRIREI